MAKPSDCFNDLDEDSAKGKSPSFANDMDTSVERGARESDSKVDDIDTREGTNRGIHNRDGRVGLSDAKDESEGDSASDSEESDSSNDQAGGLSELEKRRMERIQRNNEVLSRLGLTDITLETKSKQQRKREKREVDPGDVRKSARRCAKKVNYAEQPTRLPVVNLSEEEIRRKEKRKKERPREMRMERYIFNEFQRVRWANRNELKIAEKKFRYAQLEHRFALRQVELLGKQGQRKRDITRTSATVEAEKLKFGKSLRDLLQEIDQRQFEIQSALYERNKYCMSEEKREYLEKQRLEQERKMEVIDAINGFPSALKEAVNGLNFLLVERAPKDPPLPRQSDRKRREMIGRIGEADQVSDAAPVSPESDEKMRSEEWHNLAAAIVGGQQSLNCHVEENEDFEDETKQDQDIKKIGQRKKHRNVGGWIHPSFASRIDRSWLDADRYESNLELSKYVPQAGDLVLYYPSGHQEFLTAHPDVLGKKTRNKTRMPLWERAIKEKYKVKGFAARDFEFNQRIHADATLLSESNKKVNVWWTDDWVDNVHNVRMYPVICRVERTHAEFPPDLEGESTVVMEGVVQTVVFKPLKLYKKKNMSKPPLRLAVTLKPLTPLVPPEWNNENFGLRESTLLSLPPTFQVVTFPSKCAPFLIPFGYGYSVAHAVSVGDTVKLQNQVQSTGIINSFLSLGEKGEYGSLDANASRIASLLALFKGSDSDHLVSLLESSLNLAGSPKNTFPLTEAGVVINILAAWTKRSGIVPAALDVGDPTGCLAALIMMTLPLWKGVLVTTETMNALLVSPWDLEAASPSFKRPTGVAYTKFIDQVLADNGLMYYLDEALRAKLEFSLDDFLKGNEDAQVFCDPVTDDIAPSYNCAVPQGSCFKKILRRLSRRKVVNEEAKFSYYRSVPSLLNDVGSILENCMLYNSADSDVVSLGVRVIAEAKTLIEQVVCRHQRERAAREKAEEERKKKLMLQYTARACVQINSSTSILGTKPPKSRRSTSASGETTPGPYTDALYRDWIERTHRDASWNPGPESFESSALNHKEWMPQCGDILLYSRSLHSDFVKGHEESLRTEQCNVPQFSVNPTRTSAIDEILPSDVPPNKDGGEDHIEIVQEGASTVATDRLDGVSLIPENCPIHENSLSLEQQKLLRSGPEAVSTLHSPDQNNFEDVEATNAGESLERAINSQWLVGTVVWVRRVFPRKASKKDKDNDSFHEKSPLLSIGLCFDYEWACGPQTHTVFWRPCVFPKASGAFPKSRCPSCGCEADFGFLLPGWLHYYNLQSEFRREVLLPQRNPIEAKMFFSHPVGIDSDSIAAINRCFNALKRRCLAGIPPDTLPDNFSVNSIRKGWNLPSKTGSKALPTFEHLFSYAENGNTDRSSNRPFAQNRKSEIQEEQENALPILAQFHFLPPYSTVPSKSRTKPKDSGARLHPAISYESSMCPSPKLSLELIQQRLRNGYYRRKLALIDDIQEAYVSSVLLVLSKLSCSKFGPSISAKKVAKLLLKRYSAKKEVRPDDDRDAVNIGLQFRQLENDCVEKIEKVRSLYAMALVSVSETRFAECIFGTSPKRTVTIARAVEPSEKHQRSIIAAQKLTLILTAFSRDPGNSRGRSKVNNGGNGSHDSPVLPSVAIKVVSNTTLLEEITPPLMFFPPDYVTQDRLIRCFFGKPLRMEACGRCHVFKRSMLQCRILRGHLNLDFSWENVMQGVDGIDGLLYTLRTGDPPPSRPTSGAIEVLKEQSSEEMRQRPSPNLPKNDVNEEKQRQLALERVNKASRALHLAEKLLHLARSASSRPPRLSDEFIQNSFPIDPEDGHYNYCYICGLSGDVMCCEKCPVVMHPLCAELKDVPKGDWFCPKCTKPRSKVSVELSGTDQTTCANKDREACLDVSLGVQGNDISQKGDIALEQLAVIPAGSEKESLPHAQIHDNDQDAVDGMFVELESLLNVLRNSRHGQSIMARDRKQDYQDPSFPNQFPEGEVIDENKSVVEAESEITPDAEEVREMSDSEKCDQPNCDLVIELKDDQNEDLKSENGTLSIGVGSKVSKDFGEIGRFLGVVKSLPNDDYPFYNIRYEDGDEEDMDEAELREVLIFIKPPRKRKANSDGQGPPRKRGRPPLRKDSFERPSEPQQSDRNAPSFHRASQSSKSVGFKVEYKPGVRVVPKKLKYKDKLGTIVRSVGRHTWEVKFDDGRNRGTFKSQQLSFVGTNAVDEISEEADMIVKSVPKNVDLNLKLGVRVFPRRREWRDNVGTIVGKFDNDIWKVLFDDGVDRGPFKSVDLALADNPLLTQVVTSTKGYPDGGGDLERDDNSFHSETVINQRGRQGRPRRTDPLVAAVAEGSAHTPTGAISRGESVEGCEAKDVNVEAADKPRRGRGRPRKAISPLVRTSASNARSAHPQNSPEGNVKVELVENRGRKRGRPKFVAPLPAEPESTPRKRGRPRTKRLAPAVDTHSERTRPLRERPTKTKPLNIAKTVGRRQPKRHRKSNSLS